jgi:predicted DNA-binding transcriptional regulator AlpA
VDTFLDIEELAVLMNIRSGTLRRWISQKPFAVPPKMHLGGTKMLRWRKAEVETWLYEHGHSECDLQVEDTAHKPVKC